MNNHLNGIRHYTSTFLTMKRSFAVWIGKHYGTQRTSTQLNLMEKLCKRWKHPYTWSTSSMNVEAGIGKVKTASLQLKNLWNSKRLYANQYRSQNLQ
ncbi:unnamed protein product [Schistosoma curassoni]|uniref:RNA-directed DNA polymerase n=1 Tax=Schistosoma curassoni TaxID=6186 RepID=A0A183KEJ1_9TREM|nr:unnamed protein product [Schistosoma curassoni]